jgi:hypothetical protein
MEQPERKSVLCISSLPIPREPFDERGLALLRVGIDQLKVAANFGRAILVAEGPNRVGAIRRQLEQLYPLAPDYGLALAILVGAEKDIVAVNQILSEMGIGRLATVRLLSEVIQAAEFVRSHDPGPIVGEAVIEPASIKLSDEYKTLLRRAFFDCERLFLEKITGGKASMSVFRVHAWLKPELCIVGPRPLPFFVKMAEYSSVETEKIHYRVYAEHFIPFNFRPNIDHKRCVRTRSLAALAGDFVDDAVPLRTCLKMGLASGVLFSLFETSLKGFRLQPVAAGKKPESHILAGFVRGRIKVNELLEDVVIRAKEFGLSKSPVDLEIAIYQEAAKLLCLRGPCHGDLHSGNVMVRGGDAILIDFFSAGDGPLTADPAALEASLMFGTDDEDKVGSNDEWRAFVDQIYNAIMPTLHPPALAESKPGTFSWLRRSIRELRHILLGCNVDEKEAKLVLAAYLMRFARLGLESLKNPKVKPLAFDRHAYALVIAERIVASLSIVTTPKGGS